MDIRKWLHGGAACCFWKREQVYPEPSKEQEPAANVSRDTSDHSNNAVAASGKHIMDLSRMGIIETTIRNRFRKNPVHPMLSIPVDLVPVLASLFHILISCGEAEADEQTVI